LKLNVSLKQKRKAFLQEFLIHFTKNLSSEQARWTNS
jgi:hypothetical protein